MKIVEFEADYAVGGSEGDITLTVVIGDAQIGGSAVLIDGAVVGRNQIENLKLGSIAALRGKLVHIKSVVADVNAATNRMSITWRFSGGLAPISFRATGEVSADGDMMGFRGKFRIV